MAQDDNPVPGLVLEPDLQAKLDGLDDQLQPITKDLKDEPKEDAVEEPEAEAEEPEDKEEEGTVSDDSKDPTDEEESPEPEGYTIDNEEEAEPDEEVPTVSTTEAAKSTNVSAEQQYILDNLQAITVRGTVGDNKTVQEYQVLSPEQLPQGFRYTDERELSIANKGFALLENKALELQNEYRGQESTKAAKDFKEREDNADRADIQAMQLDGELPRFKADPNSKAWDKDPANVLIQEVLDFKDAQNQKYMDEYNAGRPYKHIGFGEAYTLYRRDNPVKSNKAQDKEDAERTGIANRTKSSKGTPAGNANPVGVRTGMGSMDLDALIEQKTAGW